MCVFQGYARSRVLRAALKQAQAAVDGAKEFQALVNDFENLAKYAARIKEIASEADHITHELASLLNAPCCGPDQRDQVEGRIRPDRGISLFSPASTSLTEGLLPR